MQKLELRFEFEIISNFEFPDVFYEFICWFEIEIVYTIISKFQGGFLPHHFSARGLAVVLKSVVQRHRLHFRFEVDAILNCLK